MFVGNELPARGDVDFTEVGVDPGTDRGDKPFRKEMRWRKAVLSVTLSSETHYTFSHLRIHNNL